MGIFKSVQDREASRLSEREAFFGGEDAAYIVKGMSAINKDMMLEDWSFYVPYNDIEPAVAECLKQVDDGATSGCVKLKEKGEIRYSVKPKVEYQRAYIRFDLFTPDYTGELRWRKEDHFIYIDEIYRI